MLTNFVRQTQAVSLTLAYAAVSGLVCGMFAVPPIFPIASSLLLYLWLAYG